MNIRRVLSVAAFVAVCAAAGTSAIRAQQGPANWLTDGADSRRTAWQQNETILTTANAKDMKLLWKIKLDNQTRQMHSLFPPLIVGSAATSAGPKQIAVVAGVSDNLYGIDVEKGALLWTRHFDSTYKEPPPVPGGRGGSVLCPGGLTATPVIAPTETPGKYVLYAVSWDGRLREVDVATGEEIEPAAPFLPPNGKPYGLNLVNGVIHTTTAQGCGGNPNQFYSYDLATKKVGYYNPGSGGLWPRSGPSIGKDGTVYAGSGDGDYYPERQIYGQAIIGVKQNQETKALELKDHVCAGGTVMTRPVRHALIALLISGSAAAMAPRILAQGRGGAEWTTSGGDAQRTSWIRSDPRISVANMAKGAEGFGPFKFLWKLKVDSDPRKPNPLTQAVLLDRIIGFRGFKSVAFVATSSGTVYAIDTDFGSELWKVHLNYGASLPPMTVGTAECPAGVTAALTRPTALAVSAFGGGGGGGRGGRSGGGVGEAGRGAPSIYTAGQGRGGGAPPGLPATPGAAVPGSAAAAAQAGRAGGPGGGGGGRGQATGAPDAAYAIGNDGYVRALNVQSGWEMFPPVQFLPANSRPAGAIVVNDETTGFLYAVTTRGCGYTPDAVWAVDLISPRKEVVSWEARGATIAGSGGPAFGRDGTIYVATTDGSSPLSNSVVALEPKTLKQKAAFTLAKADFVSAPIVVQQKDKDLVVVAAKDGRIFLLDGASLQVPLAATPAAGPLSGDGLASWQDEKGGPWILAAGTGSVVAYQLVEEGSGLALQKGWTSRALVAPLRPLVVNGVVFALSSGEEDSAGAAARAARSSPAVLYALDGASGKEIWNSGKSITASARGGLSAGAGVVYVPATDSTLYAFGFPIEK